MLQMKIKMNVKSECMMWRFLRENSCQECIFICNIGWLYKSLKMNMNSESKKGGGVKSMTQNKATWLYIIHY